MIRINLLRCPLVLLLLTVTCVPGLLEADENSPARTTSEALDAPLTAPIRAVSLLQMAADLSRTEGINVCIAGDALRDAGISAAQIGPFEISGVTLRSALHAVLRPYDLKFLETHDVVLITTADHAESDEVWRIHPALDLVRHDARKINYDSLSELLSTMVRPQSWPAHTGPVPIDGAWGCLIFEQSAEVHGEVARLLHGLRTVPCGERDHYESIRVGNPLEVKFAREVNGRLDQLIDLDLEDITLAEFAELLRSRFELPVRFDISALNDDGLNPVEQRLSLSVRQIPLRSAISLLLRPHRLTTFLGFEQFWITTTDRGALETHLEIYPVPDLIAADTDRSPSHRNWVETLLRQKAFPTTWSDAGGPCDLLCYPPLQCLVVLQTETGHAEVARFLHDLRKRRASVARLDTQTKRTSQQIEQWLESPTGTELKQVGLPTLISLLQERGVSTMAQRMAIEKLEVASTTVLGSVPSARVSWATALEILLAPHALEFVEIDGQLVITTADYSNTHLKTQVYPVADLVASPQSSNDSDPLIEVLTYTVEPRSWSDNGGLGSCRLHRGDLAVSQTDGVHRQIARLLAALRTARDQANTRVWAESALQSTALTAWDSPEQKRADLELNSSDLREAVRELSKAFGVPIAIDPTLYERRSLAEYKSTCRLHAVSLPTALDIVLRDFDVSCLLRDELVQIAPEPSESRDMYLAVYPVRKLVDPESPAGAERPPAVDSFIAALVETVESSAWGGVGSGSIAYHPPSGCLSVRQSLAVHRKVSKFLRDLHTASSGDRVRPSGAAVQ